MENAIKITKPGFKKFRDEHADKQQSFRGCSISADEKFIFCYNNYMKQWRHSFYADYYIFDIEQGRGFLARSTTEIANTAFVKSLGF